MLLLALLACGPPRFDDSGSADCANVDLDADGSSDCDDCDDGDALIAPGAPERCNGQDDDCDGAPTPEEVDADADGALDCAACDAAGYWTATQGLTGSVLTTAIHDATEGIDCTYDAARYRMFLYIDNVDGLVECVYTGRQVAVSGSLPDAEDMNTEHTWPQSLGAELEPAKCDLNHLYPSDSDANNYRGNLPFGEVTSSVSWTEGGSSLGEDADGDTVFEPRDAHKGDVARSMFYFSIRYDLPLYDIDVFRTWHLADPPDAVELARMNGIVDYQGVGNPLVACPGLVDSL
jgi:hypothetical protein